MEELDIQNPTITLDDNTPPTNLVAFVSGHLDIENNDFYENRFKHQNNHTLMKLREKLSSKKKI